VSERSCDVAVVGGGGAGLAAAITAAELGRKVILLEKADALGGSTALSIGSVTAAGTPDQKAAGVEDSPAEHLADFPAWAGPLAHRDNLELARVLTDNAAGALAWLRASGLEFYGPLPEPPHRKPRMHNVLPNSRAFVFHLSRRARRAGVEVVLSSKAQKLLLDDSSVTGVETAKGRFAAKSVVLAGGDFSGSAGFRREYAAPEFQDLPAVNVHAEGDCQRMARDAGGVIVNGDLAYGEPRYRFRPPAGSPWWLGLPPVRPVTSLMRFALRRVPAPLIRPFILSFLTTALAPETRLFDNGAVLVNAQGDDFRREGESLGFAIARQPEKQAYALLDAQAMEVFSRWPNYVSTAPGVAYAYIDDYRRTRPDICAVGDLDEVARARGMNPERLKEHFKSGQAKPPYLLLGPIHSYVVLADGGLAVSTTMQVLDRSRQAISGLYAAGSSGQGGLLLRGHGHHLAWAFVSGRIAGASAAA
jgi:fumarate reductase flavoprotein subunit